MNSFILIKSEYIKINDENNPVYQLLDTDFKLEQISGLEMKDVKLDKVKVIRDDTTIDKFVNYFNKFDRYSVWLNLFEGLLDELNLEYSHDIEYCLASIKNYRKTCLNPEDHYGCHQSLIWLAWCHSLCLINDIQINESLDESKSLSDLTDIFAPYQSQFLEMSKQHMFDWKD
jgi:hypothetical protein